MLIVRTRIGLIALLALLPMACWFASATSAAELVMFESPGCPWCARWHAEVGPGYPKSDEGKRAPLRMHPLASAATAGVQFTSPVIASPTFVLVDEGREVGRIVGYPGADFFWALLGQMMPKLKLSQHGASRPASSRPFSQHLANARP